MMLGFDEKDGSILAALGRKNQNVLSLASATKLNRVTVAYRLKRLALLGLVEEQPSPGKQKVWRLSTTSSQHKRHVQVYYRGDMLRARSAFFASIPKKSVLYTIEGLEYIRTMNKKSPSHPTSVQGIQLQTDIRRRNVTIKAIVHAEFLTSFAKNSTEFLEVRHNRPIVFKQFRNLKSLLGPCVYGFTPKGILIENTKKQYAIVIKDPAVAHVLYDMIGILYELLDYPQGVERLNIDQFIEHLLAKKAAP